MSPGSMGRMLEAADLLVSEGARNVVFRRRAISAAYYAIFHAVAKLCADYVARSAHQGSEDYQRVYRALDHGPMRNVFARPPFSVDERTRQISAAFLMLQAERHRADYMPAMKGMFSVARTKELVAVAREAVEDIEGIDAGDDFRRKLAISLLFKERGW